MENQKKYLRVKDIMEAAVKKAQEDPLFQEAEKECVLDYHQLCFTTRFDEVKLCSFNVIGHPEYGGSEGIYGTIQFFGEWVPQHSDNCPQGSTSTRLRPCPKAKRLSSAWG